MFTPRYSISNKVLKFVGLVEAAREVVDNAPLVPAWEAKFREDAVVRTVHFGTHVEGNDLTLAETEKVMRQDPQRDDDAAEIAERAGVVARSRDVQEVINYRNVLTYLDQLLIELKREAGMPYKVDQLLQIHALSTERILPANEVGAFRNAQVVIRGLVKGEVVSRPPLAVEVPYQIKDFFTWLNNEETKELHPVIKAAICHYELSRIHPFTEGNGRTARAMTLLILANEGIDAKRFFSIEEHFDKNIHEYYDAFLKVAQAGGDMTAWIEFFSESLAVEMNKVKERVQRLSIDSRLRGKMGKQISLSERQISLIEYLENHEAMTMNEAREMVPMVSDDTLLRDLTELIKKGLIRKLGKTKGARYILKPVHG